MKGFLILTTIPHLLEIGYTMKDRYHTAFIVLGTASSILWHTSPSSTFLNGLNYTLTVSWALYEVELSLRKGCFKEIFDLYFLLLLSHALSEYISYNNILSYELTHGIWHLLSAARAVKVGYLLEDASEYDTHTCTVVGVQCCAVVGIYFITITVPGIAFPAAILALIPIRLYLLPRLVGALELEALDARGWGADTHTA